MKTGKKEPGDQKLNMAAIATANSQKRKRAEQILTLLKNEFGLKSSLSPMIEEEEKSSCAYA